MNRLRKLFSTTSVGVRRLSREKGWDSSPPKDSSDFLTPPAATWDSEWLASTFLTTSLREFGLRQMSGMEEECRLSKENAGLVVSVTGGLFVSIRDDGNLTISFFDEERLVCSDLDLGRLVSTLWDEGRFGMSFCEEGRLSDLETKKLDGTFLDSDLLVPL